MHSFWHSWHHCDSARVSILSFISYSQIELKWDADVLRSERIVLFCCSCRWILLKDLQDHWNSAFWMFICLDYDCLPGFIADYLLKWFSASVLHLLPRQGDNFLSFTILSGWCIQKLNEYSQNVRHYVLNGDDLFAWLFAPVAPVLYQIWTGGCC